MRGTRSDRCSSSSSSNERAPHRSAAAPAVRHNRRPENGRPPSRRGISVAISSDSSSSSGASAMPVPINSTRTIETMQRCLATRRINSMHSRSNSNTSTAGIRPGQCASCRHRRHRRWHMSIQIHLRININSRRPPPADRSICRHFRLCRRQWPMFTCNHHITIHTSIRGKGRRNSRIITKIDGIISNIENSIFDWVFVLSFLENLYDKIL